MHGASLPAPDDILRLLGLHSSERAPMAVCPAAGLRYGGMGRRIWLFRYGDGLAQVLHLLPY